VDYLLPDALFDLLPIAALVAQDIALAEIPHEFIAGQSKGLILFDWTKRRTERTAAVMEGMLVEKRAVIRNAARKARRETR